MRRRNLPVAALVLGLILGPLAEEYFRVSMASHSNNVWIFFTRPISRIIMALSFISMIYSLLKGRLVKPRESDQAPLSSY